MAAFKYILKSLRTSMQLTQDELAKKLNISRSTIGMYEKGAREPDFETLELIADFFNVDIDYLLGRTTKTTYLVNGHTNDLGNKEIMAKNIRYYMNKHSVSQTEICNTLGFKMPTFSDWVNAKTYPRIDKIELMANYFGISKADLVEDHDKMSESTDSYYLNDDARELAEFMFKNPEYKVLFDASRKVKKDDIEFVKEMIDRMNRTSDDTGC